MRQEQLENKRNSTEYLERLEKWYLLRWKRRLELLQETTEDLWLLRKVIKERLNIKYGVIAFPKDEDKR